MALFQVKMIKEARVAERDVGRMHAATNSFFPGNRDYDLNLGCHSCSANDAMMSIPISGRSVTQRTAMLLGMGSARTCRSSSLFELREVSPIGNEYVSCSDQLILPKQARLRSELGMSFLFGG